MKRITLTFAALALAAGLAAGCSKSNDTSTASTSTSAVKSDASLPGGGNLDKTLNDAQKCTDMATAYAGLFTPLMGGGGDENAKKQVQGTLEDMKGKVPDKIKTDLQQIEDGLKKNTSLMDLGTYLSSAEFTKANDEVTKYLTTECAKVGQ